MVQSFMYLWPTMSYACARGPYIRIGLQGAEGLIGHSQQVVQLWKDMEIRNGMTCLGS